MEGANEGKPGKTERRQKKTQFERIAGSFKLVWNESRLRKSYGCRHGGLERKLSDGKKPAFETGGFGSM